LNQKLENDRAESFAVLSEYEAPQLSIKSA